ncbi:hypothetical protein BGW41_000435 [Actinomortierella wolfii]|nr:hypothetical protein BGW41_000435 [Actinomortierella wolfii]
MSETIGTATLHTTSTFSASPTLEPTSTTTTTFEISPTTSNPPSNKGGELSVGVVLPVVLAVIFIVFCSCICAWLRIRHQRRHDHHAMFPQFHKNPPSYKAAVPMAVGAAAGMTAVAVATANDGHPAEVIVLSEADTAFGMPFGPDIKDPKDALEVAADVTAAWLVQNLPARQISYLQRNPTRQMALSSAVLMTVTVAVTVMMMIVVVIMAIAAIAAIATTVVLVVVMVPVVDRSTP